MTVDERELGDTLSRALGSRTAGEWEAFIGAAYSVVASGVIRALTRWCKPDRERVDDLIQETFLKLCADDFQILRQFRSAHPNALAAYLRVIASSVVSDSLRADHAQKRGAGVAVENLDENPNAASDDSLQRTERRILLAQVDRCLGSQPPRDRRIFWLYYRHGLTSRAISAISALKLTASGVDSAIHRLTQIVRACLKTGNAPRLTVVEKGNSA